MVLFSISIVKSFFRLQDKEITKSSPPRSKLPVIVGSSERTNVLLSFPDSTLITLAFVPETEIAPVSVIVLLSEFEKKWYPCPLVPDVVIVPDCVIELLSPDSK